MSKRKFSGFTLRESMELMGREMLLAWRIAVPPRPPSDYLKENLRRLQCFDTDSTEQAKTLLIDALFTEIVPNHPRLKVWKAAALDTDTLTGVADYLIAPVRAYVATPLLCVTEAKRDDFEGGRAQCLAEMSACHQQNRKDGHDTDVFGIVSNGQIWRFYKSVQEGDVFESEQYAIREMPELLGILDYVCMECEKAVP